MDGALLETAALNEFLKKKHPPAKSKTTVAEPKKMKPGRSNVERGGLLAPPPFSSAVADATPTCTISETASERRAAAATLCRNTGA